MKIAPTLERGLRVDMESDDDWILLQHIAHDALTGQQSLGARVSAEITDPAVADDWRDFVIADLDEQFLSSILHVTRTIAAARTGPADQESPLWITADDGFIWFSALNQARLGLEDEYHFGPEEQVDLERLDLEARAAFVRSRFYCAVQSLLLEHVMS